MLKRSSAMVEPMRSAARRSGPDTAVSVRAAASASTLATTSGITTISQTRSMSGAESPVPARDRGPRIRNPLRGKKIPSARAAGPNTPDNASSSRQPMLWGFLVCPFRSGRPSRVRRSCPPSWCPRQRSWSHRQRRRGQGCAAVRPNDCDGGCCLAAAKARPVQVRSPCPLVSSERNWERRDG
jgi:hypothetical protein